MTFLRELKVAKNAAFSWRSCISMDLTITDEINWIEGDVGKVGNLGIRYQLATFIVSFTIQKLSQVSKMPAFTRFDLY